MPTAVLALANARLRDVDEALSRKLDATSVSQAAGFNAVVGRSVLRDTDRRVLGLVRAAGGAMGGADQVALPRGSRLAPGPSKYAVLGTVGFELPTYADLFAPVTPVAADVYRRGTPDPHRSLVAVPAARLALRTGELLKTATAADAAPEAGVRGRAFALGLLASVASGVVVGPVERGMFNRRTRREWTRYSRTADHADADAEILRRLVGGATPGSTWRSWWPAPADVDRRLFDALAAAAGEVFPTRGQGWPSFEAGVHEPPAVTGESLATGYERFRSFGAVDNLSAWAWWGLLTPILLGPSITLLAARALPHAKRFQEPGELTERSFSELITLGETVGSVAPFIYSMIMWSQIPSHTEVFVNSLVLFLARLALFGTWVPTIGDEADDPLPELRWIVAAGMLGTDVYALIRGIVATADTRQPGRAPVFFLQTVAGATAGVAVLAGLLTKAVNEIPGLDPAVGSWLNWGLLTAGLWLGAGIPIAIALEKGSGWRSWFLPNLPLSVVASTEALGDRREPAGPAAVFDDSTLWTDAEVAAGASADPAHTFYPLGSRPLLKVWFDGDGEASISVARHAVTVHHGGTDTPVPLGPGKRTVAGIALSLRTAVLGLHAEPVDSVVHDLPWPSLLADPGTDQATPADQAAHAADVIPLPRAEDKAHLLRHAPRADNAAGYGLHGAAPSLVEAPRMVPGAGLGDREETVLGTAADLACLLAMGAMPSLATVAPATPTGGAALADLGPVQQVFRQWNLDERRVNEWRMLVAGGAAPEGPAPAPVHPGRAVADALGWVPLWRSWVRMAADPTTDTESAVAMPYTPEVRSGDGSRLKATNRQLSDGVRYLLDLPDP